MLGLSPIVAALTFAAGLFAFAAWVERRREIIGRHRLRRAAYTLSLGVYCTSWTFYGAVGSAASDGWSYLPIYLGPMLIFLFAPRFLQSLVAAVRAEGATSISDFIGSRFGKSRGLAALVTITAALGIVPYIALQLRSVGSAFGAVTGSTQVNAVMTVTALVLAGFAIVFGTRRYDLAGKNEGLVFATALESLVKIAAMLGIGVVAMVLLLRADATMADTGYARFRTLFAPSGLTVDLVVITLLAMAAILCLPRQFYMGVIEARASSDIRRARLPFVLYLALMSAVVVPITVAGSARLPPGTSPDLFILALPQAIHSRTLTMIAFLGGFSAAVAMVVVETVALSTMVSNDLIAPLLLNSRLTKIANLGNVQLRVRRASILCIIMIALLWALGIHGEAGLASIGYIAFAGTAQIAPFLIMAVRGRNRDALPAKVALSGGLVVWLYTLAIPPILPPEWLAALSQTPLDPHRLFHIGGASALTHGVAWSLGANIALLAVMTARVRAPRPGILFGKPHLGSVHNLGQLATFVGRFIGAERAGEAFGTGLDTNPIASADARRAERLIAGVVGAPTARALVASALADTRLSHADIVRMLDEGGHSLQFSKGLLAATLENIDPGVSVIDDDLRLIAWNSRYVEMFGYPEGMVRVGTPVADLIRFNAARGECGPGEVDAHVERRLAHLRRGAPHSFERRRDDGRVLKTVGGPMPGGYVMCFTDITAEAHAREELERARTELETRVAERTAELSEANARLALATRDKTRFLAAASHDLLQPLHAARLFASALHRDLAGQDTGLVVRIEQSISAAEQLLRALLDISKLDAGGIEPAMQAVALRPLLEDVVNGFRPLAEERGIALRLGPAFGTVEADPALLRSIVQNLLSNAVRYTERGGVLVGVRRRGDALAVIVADTGPGIPADKQQQVFREFERLDSGNTAGIGLGLAIVERTARLIGATIALRSAEGRGSIFSATLPRASTTGDASPRAGTGPARSGIPRRVLVVDDNPAILDASRAHLQGAGHIVTTATDAAGAMAQCGTADIALVDCHLGGGDDGIALIESLHRHRPGLRAALVTADTTPATRRRAAERAIPILPKPLDPGRLDAWLADQRPVAND